MICQQVLPSMDISAALLLLNTLLMGVVGYFLRDFFQKQKEMTSRIDQHTTEIAVMKTQQENDRKSTSLQLDNISDQLKSIEKKLDDRDNDLIRELKEALSKRN